MNQPLLKCEHVDFGYENYDVVKDVSMEIVSGDYLCIVGENGSGKSTLSSVLVGNPAFEVTKGSVTFDGKNLLDLSPEDRSHEGLFLSFQYPVEIPANTKDFLH